LIGGTDFAAEEGERMGREATCEVHWAGESGRAKVLLESQELIVRGTGDLSRRSVPFAALAEIEVRGEALCFRAGDEGVSLALGAAQAQSWAKKLTSPAPTLAAKLGIGAETRLALMGNFDGGELAQAVREAATRDSRNPDLILALVKSAADLNYALDVYGGYAAHPPIWIVYPKGAGKPIGETEIRDTMRRSGLMDTKVASVSAVLTGLRFNWRG
jgi:hypothetical protein